MNPIAMELDQKLKGFDRDTAASVERLVRDALQLAEKKPVPAGNPEATAAHQAHIAKFAGIWAGDDFARPPQGESEKREDW